MDRSASTVRPPRELATVAEAVLFATAPGDGGGPAALLPFDGATVLDRLIGQLHELGVQPVHVVARLEDQGAVRAVAERAPGAVQVHASQAPADDLRLLAELARGAAAPLAIAHAELVCHRSALGRLVGDEHVRTAILDGARPSGFAVRSLRGRVLSAGSPWHAVGRPTAGFLGALTVADADRPLLEATADRLGAWLAGDAEVRRRVELAGDDVLALLLVGLVRTGMRVGERDVRGLYWARPRSAAAAGEAQADLATADEERALLDAAVKARDGFFTTFFVSPYSKYLARWAARARLTPNVVTTVSLLVGVVAAAAFVTGDRWGLIAGAVLLQLAFTLDCVDGQLARYTRRFSALGGWLDSIFDRAKEFAVYAGLAIGSSRAGDAVWVLASAALALQTVRHAADFAFADTQEEAIDETPPPPLEQPGDGVAADPAPAARLGDEVDLPAPERAGSAPARVLGAWQAGNRIPAMPWIRRMIAFPIGERFAAISVTAALWTARTTFVVLLAWGGLAAAYTNTGRVLRSLTRVRGRRFAWMITPLVRAFEYAMLIWIATLAGDSSKPAAFALLCALAFHHYDLVYRSRHQGRTPPTWVRVVSLGWEGRVALAWILLAVGALPAGFYVMAIVFGVVFVAEAAFSWTRPVAAAAGGYELEEDEGQ